MQNKFSCSLYFSVAFIASLMFILPALQGCNRPAEVQLQTLPMHRLPLTTLDAFQPVAENWSLAGGVQSNRRVEHDLHGLEGTGILVNNPTIENEEHLFTTWTHGDLELELDFLMPKGSNSGIYLMGRYEVQLFDSWGTENPRYSDVGGIYRQRDERQPEGQKEYGGSDPRMNAAKAPGLWQRLKILFRAPEFSSTGRKIANALFEEVWLNGALVQENVEVSGPTISARFNDEQAEGPLMIQGDHGPVAFRNITYKKYDKKETTLTDLTYEYYPGEFNEFPDFASLEAAEISSADSLAGNIVSRDDRYALRYTGTLNAPNSGTYLFKLQTAGMVRMSVGDQVVIDQNRPYRMHELVTKTLELESGQHTFSLEYVNHPNNWYRGLALFTEGPRLRFQKLHASSSIPSGGRELPDLFVEASDRVKVLRSFAMHRDTKRTHVVNVGAPNGIAFNYDMGQAALLHAWEGPFLNVNQMWIDRGEPQIATPSGSPVSFDGKPLVAMLTSSMEAWPDSVSWDELKVEGYTLPDGGWPVFKYTFHGIRVEDRFEGYIEDRRLIRTITLKASAPHEDVWLKLASGKEISRTGDEYVVDDRSYYLNLIDTGGREPQIVRSGKEYDLRLPVLTDGTEAEYTYEIVW